MKGNTLERLKPIAIVDAKNKDAWHAGRAKGVTKSDMARLISGTLASKREVYAGKQGGKRFGGNEHTRRGHEYEPGIALWVESQTGIPSSQMLYASGANSRHLATPDCFVWDEDEGSLVEIKTTFEDWSRGLPASIIRDVLWQRYVTGAGWSAVAWQRFDRDGQPITLEPELVEVPEDPAETARLIRVADEYLAWVDAGCPEDESDVPPDVRDAAEEVAHAKQVIAEREPVVWEWAMSQPNAATDGVKRSLSGAVIALTITNGSEFDEAAARAAEPEAFVEIDRVLADLADIRKRFVKRKTGTRKAISFPKQEGGAAA